MRFVVDAVEDDVARLEAEDGRVFEVPADWLPEGLRGGDVLALTPMREAGRSLVAVRVDPAAREARLETARGRLERLRARDPGGDVEL